MNGEQKSTIYSLRDDNVIIAGESSLIAAAHELKAPLALIRQLAFLLEDGELSDVQKRRIATQARLATEKALRLTTDLTKVARLEDAMFQLEPVNPTAICDDVVRELDEYFAAHGKTLSVQNTRSLPLVIAHHDLLRRILLTFSDNALQYGGDDVQLTIRRTGGKIRIAVRDYGPALQLGDFMSIKQKLAAPQSVHARPQSSGLGLYIASQFAQMMHGAIGMTRHRDGVSFYIDMNASTQLRLI